MVDVRLNEDCQTAVTDAFSVHVFPKSPIGITVTTSGVPDHLDNRINITE